MGRTLLAEESDIEDVDIAHETTTEPPPNTTAFPPTVKAKRIITPEHRVKLLAGRVKAREERLQKQMIQQADLDNKISKLNLLDKLDEKTLYQAMKLVKNPHPEVPEAPTPSNSLEPAPMVPKMPKAKAKTPRRKKVEFIEPETTDGETEYTTNPPESESDNDYIENIVPRIIPRMNLYRR